MGGWLRSRIETHRVSELNPYVNKIILNKSKVIGAKWDENGLLVDCFGLESKRHLIRPVENILIEHIQIGIVFDRSVHKCGSIYTIGTLTLHTEFPQVVKDDLNFIGRLLSDDGGL